MDTTKPVNKVALTGSSADDEALEISPKEVQQMLDRGDDFQLLDVREPHEVVYAKIDGSVNIPLGDLPTRQSELDHNRPIVVYCHGGVRSVRGLKILQAAGFTNLKSLRGGLKAWSAEVDPSLPRYESMKDNPVIPVE